MQCIDANRAFVLYCCSMVNKNIASNNGNNAFEFAQIAFYDTYQMLEESDNHYKQVIQNLSQSLNLGKKTFS